MGAVVVAKRYVHAVTRIVFEGGGRRKEYPFPVEEGRKFARALIDEGREFNDLQVVLDGVESGLLISVFFLAFFKEIEEAIPVQLKDALAIRWDTEFDFQRELIAEWVRMYIDQMEDMGALSKAWQPPPTP